MPGKESRHGWVPEIGSGTTIEQVVEAAFEYRGDVSVDRVDGTTVVGYLFNRNATSPAPFAEVITSRTGERVRLPYDQIKNIRFTGRDTAAGESWDAWRRRRDANAKATAGE
jgi:hypothetical protein